MKFSDKLLNDALHELNILYSEFKKLPSYTRESFEIAEENYYTQSLERQARGISGAVESLINIREDVPAIEQYLEKIKTMDNLTIENLTELRLAMPNQLDNVAKKEKQLQLENAKKNKKHPQNGYIS
jgi:hypothetical protein